jgi:hypothetical protein
MANYTEEQFAGVVASSSSIAGVLRALGLKPAGGNYATVRNKVASLGLDTSHWTGQAWSAGTIRGRRKSLEDILVRDSTYKSYHLKARLLSDGVLDSECSSCGRTEWLGVSIPLELDHIDGDPTNNTLENLRILCPNCHALTPTYRNNKR